ncbi:hypothetical protein LVY72_07895 [Arthrobacter sp. I2-34]|uniref:Uncharacterized protein n=1 Tax=Arthrobacter hankyongi TaxID=2904801 RepID=A0ABS9L5I1_9MICC|nr:hypothetical protein [Arthrobacter hankyongi]MCG2621838.1 hypothetical protein [Arthrobacter hankyongi]
MRDHAEWKNLVGLQVQIQKDGRTIRTGLVDAVTEDAGALWLAAYGVDVRALYDKAEGYTVVTVSDEARVNS